MNLHFYETKQRQVKQIEKMKKVGEQWVELCYYSCFASRVVGFGSTKLCNYR
jgi:hypothetical protein